EPVTRAPASAHQLRPDRPQRTTIQFMCELKPLTERSNDSPGHEKRYRSRQDSHRTELRLHATTNIPDATHKLRAKQASTTGRKRRAVKLVTSPSSANSPKAICATACTFWLPDCEADRRLNPLWSPVHAPPRSSSRATARTRRRTMSRGGMRRGLYGG